MSRDKMYEADERLVKEAKRIVLEGKNDLSYTNALRMLLALTLENRDFNADIQTRVEEIEKHPLHDRTLARLAALIGMIAVLVSIASSILSILHIFT